MTQDHASPMVGDSTGESLFETTMRGYNKRQVDDFLNRATAELNAAQEASQSSRRKSEEAQREVQRAREELARVRSEVVNPVKPQHEEVSERLAQILRLADEEADQKRAKAASEADSTLEAARDQSSKVLEAARSAAEGIISAARERAEKEAAAAKAEAENLLANAASSSQATIDDAEARAAAVLSNADSRSGQITTLQNERLAALREVHTDTLRRLEVVRGALEKVLTAEIDAGPPDGTINPAPLPAAGEAMRASDVDPRVGAAHAAARTTGGSIGIGAGSARRPGPGTVSAAVQPVGAPPNSAPRMGVGKRGIAAEVNLVNDGTLEDLSLQGETLRAADYAEGADEANTATGMLDQNAIAKAMEG